jgi:hypothetical protein
MPTCPKCNVKKRGNYCNICRAELTPDAPDTSLSALHAHLLKHRSAAIAILDKLEVIPTAAGAPLVELDAKQLKQKAAKEAEAVKYGTWAIELKALMDRDVEAVEPGDMDGDDEEPEEDEDNEIDGEEDEVLTLPKGAKA